MKIIQGPGAWSTPVSTIPFRSDLASCRAAGDKPAGFLRRLYEAFMQSRQRRVDTDIARLLGQSGGRLTDEVERRMTERLIGNDGFRP
jgi:hypothetical protein